MDHDSVAGRAHLGGGNQLQVIDLIRVSTAGVDLGCRSASILLEDL